MTPLTSAQTHWVNLSGHHLLTHINSFTRTRRIDDPVQPAGHISPIVTCVASNGNGPNSPTLRRLPAQPVPRPVIGAQPPDFRCRCSGTERRLRSVNAPGRSCAPNCSSDHAIDLRAGDTEFPGDRRRPEAGFPGGADQPLLARRDRDGLAFPLPTQAALRGPVSSCPPARCPAHRPPPAAGRDAGPRPKPPAAAVPARRRRDSAARDPDRPAERAPGFRPPATGGRRRAAPLRPAPARPAPIFRAALS